MICPTHLDLKNRKTTANRVKICAHLVYTTTRQIVTDVEEIKNKIHVFTTEITVLFVFHY